MWLVWMHPYMKSWYIFISCDSLHQKYWLNSCCVSYFCNFQFTCKCASQRFVAYSLRLRVFEFTTNGRKNVQNIKNSLDTKNLHLFMFVLLLPRNLYQFVNSSEWLDKRILNNLDTTYFETKISLVWQQQNALQVCMIVCLWSPQKRYCLYSTRNEHDTLDNLMHTSHKNNSRNIYTHTPSDAACLYIHSVCFTHTYVWEYSIVAVILG